MSDMVKMEVVIPKMVHNMLFELLDEFEEETGKTAERDLMIAGAISLAYMMRH